MNKKNDCAECNYRHLEDALFAFTILTRDPSDPSDYLAVLEEKHGLETTRNGAYRALRDYGQLLRLSRK